MSRHIVRNAEEVRCQCGCGEYYFKDECVKLEFEEDEAIIISRQCLEEVYGKEALKRAKPL